MDRFDIQKLRDLPIEAVAERLGLAVVRHRSLCCFHDDHRPSLTFDVRRNNFRCFSCGAHGGVIDLAMEVLKLGFVEACRWLAGANHLPLTVGDTESAAPPEADRPFDASRYERYFEHPWLSAAARRFLFAERRLHPAVVAFCRLNSYNDWLQIPYYDADRRLTGIQRRYLGSDANQPRFRFMRGKSCHLYNLPVVPMLRTDEPLFVGEGPSDVWALLSSGRKAVGIPSATLLKRQDLDLLTGMLAGKRSALHIYPDRDEAGEALYHRLLTLCNERGLCLVRHTLPDGCKDFADYYMSHFNSSERYAATLYSSPPHPDNELRRYA